LEGLKIVGDVEDDAGHGFICHGALEACKALLRGLSLSLAARGGQPCRSKTRD
jgi:hypothetical protein